jgi:predicted DNA binding protein
MDDVRKIMRQVTIEIELKEAAREERRATFEHIHSYEVLEVLKMDYEQALFVDLIECVTKEGVSIHDLPVIGHMEVLSVIKSEGNRHTCLVKGREEGEMANNYAELDLDLIYTTPSFQSEDRVVLSFIGEQRNLMRFVEMLRGADFGTITNMTFKRGAYQRRDLLSVLTDRQREVMVAAFRFGYYDLPKGISSQRLAERVGMSKPTMLEHLRKAERRILAEIMAGYAE